MSGRLEPDPRTRPQPVEGGGVLPIVSVSGPGRRPAHPHPPNTINGTGYIYLGRYNMRHHKQRRTEFIAELSRR